MKGHTRRTALKLAGAAVAAGALPAFTFANTGQRRHGITVIGDLKYAPDFPHFDYVNPAAPKGGRIATTAPSWAYNQNPSTFNTLNNYVLRGDGAMGMGLTYAALMVASSDEPGSAYVFAASGLEVSDDKKTLRFFLRPEARFHDGSPITAADVVFSIETLREKGHPLLSTDLKGVVSVTADDPQTVTIRLGPDTGPSLPITVATTPIFSRAWWQGRDFEASLSEAPLGSGAYKVKSHSFGRYIEFERVPDFWAAKLPIMVGRFNLDIIRYEYYRDRTVSFEAFKKGDLTVREEFTSRVWATQYDFPAVTEKRIIKGVLPDGRPSGAQGWFMNLRRPKFQDKRVRMALALAFDFEWTNRNLMYNSYQRTFSYFENSPLKAEGKPGPAELALLEPFRAKLDPEVFADVYQPPKSDGSGRDRNLLRQASELLAAAGLKNSGGKLIGKDGQPFTIEFLDDDNTFEPHHNAYINGLRLLGIDASYRVVDPSQYQARQKGFDFDMTVSRFSMPLYPDEGVKQFFSSDSARREGSYNLSGIADPAIDALLEKVVHAKEWDEFTAAGRALDRVLRAGHYWVPHWTKASHWLAYWDMYDRPEKKPPYDTGILDTWWFNPQKAARVGR